VSKYIVSGTITISCMVEVEANSEAEAWELAADAPMQTLCSNCSSGELGSWSASELDGEPNMLTVQRKRDRY
jgi:hypothetical protein